MVSPDYIRLINKTNMTQEPIENQAINPDALIAFLNTHLAKQADGAVLPSKTKLDLAIREYRTNMDYSIALVLNKKAIYQSKIERSPLLSFDQFNSTVQEQKLSFCLDIVNAGVNDLMRVCIMQISLWARIKLAWKTLLG
jgi:hypothetical protein